MIDPTDWVQTLALVLMTETDQTDEGWWSGALMNVCDDEEEGSAKQHQESNKAETEGGSLSAAIWRCVTVLLVRCWLALIDASEMTARKLQLSCEKDQNNYTDMSMQKDDGFLV